MKRRDIFKIIIVPFVIIASASFIASCGSEGFHAVEMEGDQLGLNSTVSGGGGVALPDAQVEPPDELPLSEGIYDEEVGNVLEDFFKKADYVCRARILKVTSRYEQYDLKANLVMSRIKLEILENWKGSLKTGVEIRSFGGVLDGIPYFAAEFPRFEEGKEVILFLKEFDGGIFPLQHARGVKKVGEDKS